MLATTPASGSDGTESFPRLWARTRRWTLGEPRSFTVAGDGRRLLFLRALSGDDPRTGLWCADLGPDGMGPERLVVDPAALDSQVELTEAERARRERVRETAEGVVAFSADEAARRVVVLAGVRLLVVDLETGDTSAIDVPAGLYDARLDPTGRRIAACLGDGLCVFDVASGRLQPVAAPASDLGGEAVSWGRAEHVGAEEMGRPRGHWWSPDGESLLALRVDESAVEQWWISDPAQPEVAPRAVRYPPVGSRNADVRLWRADIGDRPTFTTEIRWDRERFEYLPAVSWPAGHSPLLSVQSRDQRTVAYLAAGEDGRTDEIARDEDEPWVELHPGSPTVLDGELVRIADVAGRRRLLIGDRPVSPVELHLRGIAGAGGGAVVVTASAADPAAVSVHRITAGGEVTLLSEEAGVHGAAVGGDVCVVSGGSLRQAGQRTTVLRGDVPVGAVRSVALPVPFAPAVERFTSPGGVRIGVVFPRNHRPGTSLPVLMDPYGGPGAQRVLDLRRAWLEPQWWADQGFAVVVADGPGTAGGPVEWETAIAGDLAGPALEAQVEALTAAAERFSDLDTGRVAIRGWSFGGFLAAMAVLRRPEIFHAAVAGAPVTDMRLYDTHYSERYLGTDPTAPSYDAASLLADAPGLSRPLLLIHGFADDNVVVAHTLRLSQRLMEGGRPHTVLPLSGVTHMTPRESVAENLLLLQRDFLMRNLPRR